MLIINMDHVRVIFNTITKPVKMCDVVIRVKIFFLIRRSYFEERSSETIIVLSNNQCIGVPCAILSGIITSNVLYINTHEKNLSPTLYASASIIY